MIEAKETLNGGVSASLSLSGVVNNAVEYIVPSLQDKVVTPNEETQTIKADKNYNGLNEVIVEPIPSDYSQVKGTIELNENGEHDVAQYEKALVNIETQEVKLQDKTASAFTSEVVVKADEGFDGLNSVTISKVTSNIDASIKEENIKKDVDILGVVGTLEPLNGEIIEITPTTQSQIILPTDGKNAIIRADVKAVTNEIDSNISDANIKKGVSILGVNGTFEGATSLQEKTIAPTTSTQEITPDDGFDAFSKITIEAVTSNIDENIVASNIKSGVDILGVSGTFTGSEATYFSTLNKTGSASMPGIYKSIVSVPSNTKITIGKYQFVNCTGLTSVPPLDYSALTDCTYMFYGCTNLTNISNLKNLKKITNANAVFSGCSKITNADLTSWSGEAITSYLGLFTGCSSLTSVNISDLKTQNGASTASMFNGCSLLKNITSNDTQIVSTSVSKMFYNCSALTTLDLSWLVTTTAVDCTQMFYRCSKLQHIDMRNMDLNLVTSRNGMFDYVPTTCEIIVKNDECKTWLSTNLGRTNVKTVAELGE